MFWNEFVHVIFTFDYHFYFFSIFISQDYYEALIFEILTFSLPHHYAYILWNLRKQNFYHLFLEVLSLKDC